MYKIFFENEKIWGVRVLKVFQKISLEHKNWEELFSARCMGPMGGGSTELEGLI
jgi:hypothetical protein